jgi:hypothetical protein
VIPLKIKIPRNNTCMREKPTNTPVVHSVLLIMYGSFYIFRRVHPQYTTVPQLSISQEALGTLPEDGNVMPKHVGATIHN